MIAEIAEKKVHVLSLYSLRAAFFVCVLLVVLFCSRVVRVARRRLSSCLRLVLFVVVSCCPSSSCLVVRCLVPYRLACALLLDSAPVMSCSRV